MENKLDTIYQHILSICDKGLPLISNLSNASSILNQLEDINWCGFYLVEDDHLILGPFQGEPACTIIPYGKGVCGTSYKDKKTIRKYLNPLLDEGLLTRTVPDKPNSRNQRYLTARNV